MQKLTALSLSLVAVLPLAACGGRDHENARAPLSSGAPYGRGEGEAETNTGPSPEGSGRDISGVQGSPINPLAPPTPSLRESLPAQTTAQPGTAQPGAAQPGTAQPDTAPR